MEQGMKVKVFVSICVLLFSNLVQGASITLSIGGEGIVTLKTDPLEVESAPLLSCESKKGGEAVFRCDDIQWLNVSGEPRIPWMVYPVLLPPYADLSSVTCSVKQSVYETIAGRWQVEPTPPMATWDENGQVIIVWPEDKRIVDGRDVDIYQRDALWPEEEARLSAKGRLRKWRLAEIAIPLVRYNPVSGELLQLASAEITVDFQRGARLQFGPELTAEGLDIDRPDPIGRERVQKIAVNFAQAAGAYDEAAWEGKDSKD